MAWDIESFLAYNKEWAKPGDYITKLTPKEEEQYRSWVDEVSIRVRPIDPNDPTYDMRGFWKAYNKGQTQPGVDETSGELHFPDTFKTPYHPTFSRESIYAKENAPYWQNNVLWEATTNIPSYGFLAIQRR